MPSFLSSFAPFKIIIHGDDDRSGFAIREEIFHKDCYGLRDLSGKGFNPQTILDIGAHIGIFAIAAHQYFPQAFIYCIEPLKKNYDLLKDNAPFAKGYHAAIVYGHANELMMMEAINASGSGFICPMQNAEQFASVKSIFDNLQFKASTEKINAITIENVLHDNAFAEIDFLKLDCEGSEWDIIEHLSDDTAKTIKCIRGEYHLFNGRTLQEFRMLARQKFPHLNFFFAEHHSHGLFGSYYEPA